MLLSRMTLSTYFLLLKPRILLTAIGSIKSRGKLMTLLIGIKLIWWLKDLNKDMTLIMKIHSIMLSNMLLFA
jgi:hypothetical protein